MKNVRPQRCAGTGAGAGSGSRVRLGGALLAVVLMAGCTFPPPLQRADVPGESARYVIVQPGENVSAIAARAGIPTSALIQENRLSEPFTVYPGQRLELPAARFHRVDQGDTLYRIAGTYGVDTDALAQVNNLDTPYTIFVGQSLRIPEAPGTPVGRETVAARPAEPQPPQSGWTDNRRSATPVIQDPPADSAPRSLAPASAAQGPASADRTVTATRLDDPAPPAEAPRPSEPENRPAPSPETVPFEADVTTAPVEQPSDANVSAAEPVPVTEVERPVVQEPAPPPAPEPQPAPAPAVSEEEANLPAVSPPAERSGDRFSWPVDGPVISTFGPKDNGQTNDGINIEAARGTPIRAADNGVVAYAGSELRGYGNLIIVRHADNWVTAYGHADRILVQRGQSVSVGDTIGEVGSTGSVTSPQIHFEIRRQSRPVDPLDHLAPR